MKSMTNVVAAMALTITLLATSAAYVLAVSPIAATPTPTQVEYQLPYPGLLPDHPLYVLKAIRDRILDMLIVDPVKKSELYILQGDKRLQMGLLLFDKGRGALGEQVISKGEKYMHQAVYDLLAQKTSGKPVPGYLTDRLERSLAKHAEVLGTLITRAGEPEKSGLSGSLELVGTLRDEVPKLK